MFVPISINDLLESHSVRSAYSSSSVPVPIFSLPSFKWNTKHHLSKEMVVCVCNTIDRNDAGQISCVASRIVYGLVSRMANGAWEKRAW